MVIVRPAMPCKARIAFVTAEALPVLCLDAGRGFLVEADDLRQLAVLHLHSCMCAAGPMTGLALQLPVAEGAARIRRHAMLGLEDGEHDGGRVARKAGISAIRRIWQVRGWGRLRV